MENTASAEQRERARLADGVSVQGRSTGEAQRDKDRSAREQRSGRRRHRIEILEGAAEDRCAGVADGGGEQHRDLRPRCPARHRGQRLHADDQADAGHARRSPPSSFRGTSPPRGG